MIGVNAISGGMVAAAILVGLVLLMLAGTIAGIALIRVRPKTGWFLVVASVASLVAFAAWQYSVLSIPRKSITVRLGAPWQDRASTCIDSAGEKMCFPTNAHYTTKIELPDGSTRTFEGEQLFVRVGLDGRIFAAQATLNPEPTTDALSTLLARELQEGSSSYRGCGGIRGAPTMEAYRHWLSVRKTDDCNVEVRHAGYLVGFELQKSFVNSDSVFAWHRIRLLSPDDRAAKSGYGIGG
jgi:hypothetical protein